MRLPDWEARFHAALDAARTREFAWVRFDCCSFAADMVLAITGVDPMSRWRGTYDDAKSAAAVIGKHGGRLHDLVSEALGDPVLPLQALRGDVVLVRNVGRYVLGVCAGAQVAVPTRIGLLFIPLGAPDVRAAWSV